MKEGPFGESRRTDEVLSAEEPERTKKAGKRLGERLVGSPEQCPFVLLAELAKAVHKHLTGPKESTVNQYLSSVFNGNKILTDDLERALHFVVAEQLMLKRGKFTRAWRAQVKECLLIHAQRRIGGENDSIEQVENSLRWADSVYVVSNGLDPLMQSWPTHPLDATVKQLLLPADRSEPAFRSRAHLVLLCATPEDAKRWLMRMTLPIFASRHRERVLGGRAASREELMGWIESFLARIGHVMDSGYLRMHVVPGPTCWLPFFTASHGRLQQTYLNLSSIEGPRFVSVSSATVTSHLELPLKAADITRYEPSMRYLEPEIRDYFLEEISSYHEGRIEALAMASKASRDPLAPGSNDVKTPRDERAALR